MGELNPVIHQAARLKIMAALAAQKGGAQVDFTTLGKLLKLSDGNLGAHLQKLEGAGYLEVEKSFVNRRPKTRVRLTPSGRKAFDAHVSALRGIIG